MLQVQIVFYRDDAGSIPIRGWLDGLQPKHRAKCLKWTGILRSFGPDLRRPESDYLRDGIHELRVKYQNLNYRMLYFFHGNQVVVLTHGLRKERDVPRQEIDRAVEFKNSFEVDPQDHTYLWEP